MLLGIHHTAISTRNADRLVEFYCQNFGCVKIYEKSWSDSPTTDALVGLPNSAARLVMLQGGNHCLEFFEYSSPVPREQDENRPVSDCGFTHVAFAVQDIDYEYERLTKAGMRFHAEPTRRGVIRVTYGRDPDGNVVELIEFLGDHPLKYAPTPARW